MKRDTIVQITGKSSTGSPHGLLVEAEPTGGLRFTVTGHDGKKRHAAVILPWVRYRPRWSPSSTTSRRRDERRHHARHA